MRDIAIQMCATNYGVTSPSESPLRTPFSVVKRNESDGPLSRFPTKTLSSSATSRGPRRSFISIMTVRNNFCIRGPH